MDSWSGSTLLLVVAGPALVALYVLTYRALSRLSDGWRPARGLRAVLVPGLAAAALLGTAAYLLVAHAHGMADEQARQTCRQAAQCCLRVELVSGDPASVHACAGAAPSESPGTCRDALATYRAAAEALNVQCTE